MSAAIDLNDTIFPAEMHARVASAYEAQATALAVELLRTRDGKARSTLAAREEQRSRNALFHRRLAERAGALAKSANDCAPKQFTSAA